MNADQMFQIVSMMVLPAWILLIFLPRWRVTQAFAFGIIIPLLGLVYTFLLIRITTSGGGFQAPDFSSLSSVIALLSDPYGAVVGWAHFLAFDLFVGAWITRDARVNGVHHLLIIVPLFFTFMAGPFGLILYLLIRQIRTQRLLAEPEM